MPSLSVIRAPLLLLALIGSSAASAAAQESETETAGAQEAEPETAAAQESEAETAFTGGRGIIAVEGPTGLFINPTSGVAPAGSVTAQVCATTTELPGGGTQTGTNLLLTYSFTDWLELGALGDDVENDGRSPAFGPLLRVRFLADRPGSALPEIAAGYYGNEGRSDQRERVVFAAASKALPIEPSAVVRSVRVHAGVRGNWRDSTDETETVGYGGLEVGLPYWVFLGVEASTDEDPFPHTPFAFGLQVRHPSGVGFTLSGVQPGFSDDIGLFIGIGINFSH